MLTSCSVFKWKSHGDSNLVRSHSSCLPHYSSRMPKVGVLTVKGTPRGWWSQCLKLKAPLPACFRCFRIHTEPQATRHVVPMRVTVRPVDGRLVTFKGRNSASPFLPSWMPLLFSCKLVNRIGCHGGSSERVRKIHPEVTFT